MEALSPLDGLVRDTLALLKPPPKLVLSEWAETYFRLPERSSAQPGRLRLWKYQRDWLDCVGNKHIPRITVIKSARIGFSKCLMAVIGGYAANNPCSVILLVPTLDDTRRYAVDEIEPSFAETPVLRGLIRRGRLDGRNTLTMKAFLGGGSLKILAARSPRNLRAHDAKVLVIDEADGMEVTSEGDPIDLAEKRTMAHADRKIILGSTPTVDGTSVVQKKYAESDQRIFEVPCPLCGVMFEILWRHIRWPTGEPKKAVCHCPHCDEDIEERHKAKMVAEGEWRATRPEITDHAGFRINALVSLLANASWGELAAEYEKAKRAGPSALMVFANTVEGRVWKTSLESIDEATLIAKAEDFDLDDIPDEVLALTAGIDTQGDRLEVTIVGWSFTTPFVLKHIVIWGSTLEKATWNQLDKLLASKWQHPNGWQMGIDAAAVDSGGTGTGAESRTQQVYDFCGPKLHRRIYAIKGMAGPRKAWVPMKQTKGGNRGFIVGVDGLKGEVLERLSSWPFLDKDGEPSLEDKLCGRNPSMTRISAKMPDNWYEGVTAERRFIRYVRNRPVYEFKPIKAGIRNEPLDCLVYAFAARHGVHIDFKERAARRADKQQTKRRSLSDFSKLNGN